MKKLNKVKRINLNIPIYILNEIDEIAEESHLTRTDIFVHGAQKEAEEIKRRKKLREVLQRKTPIFNPKDYPEIYKLGGTEWVKRLRQEGEE